MFIIKPLIVAEKLIFDRFSWAKVLLYNMNMAISALFRAVLLNIFLFLYVTLLAQPTGLFFQNYTTVNGLCDNTINSITQDSRGFIWIGTAEGLSRFDGISFRNYYGSRDSSKSFTNYNISNITEYKPHHLIFCSLGKLMVHEYAE